MLSNHFGETLQKPNAEQRFPRLQRYTRITNARLTSDNVKITEQVEKILAPKFSLKKQNSKRQYSLLNVLHAKSN